MYFQTGQVIFVPEWPKGEFVCILALFCVWTKSLMCKDALNRDSTIQSDVRRFCLHARRISSSLSAVRTIDPSRPDAHLSTVPYVWTTCSTVRTAKTDQHHPSGRSVHSVWTPYCIKKFPYQLASVRTFQQHVRTLIPHGPDALKPYKEITCSGRATVWTMCHPFRTKLLNRKDFLAKFLENLVA